MMNFKGATSNMNEDDTHGDSDEEITKLPETKQVITEEKEAGNKKRHSD
jgi:hypothetical protein